MPFESFEYAPSYANPKQWNDKLLDKKQKIHYELQQKDLSWQSKWNNLNSWSHPIKSFSKSGKKVFAFQPYFSSSI